MLQLDYLQSDESTVPVINNEKHRTVKGYISNPLFLFVPFWAVFAISSH